MPSLLRVTPIIMATMGMATMAMAMATTTTTTMATTITMMSARKQIMTCCHQRQLERNGLIAKQRGLVTQKPLCVHLNAQRRSPSRTKRRRDAMLIVVASVKSLASVSILSQ
jgi:hypothetical protein